MDEAVTQPPPPAPLGRPITEPRQEHKHGFGHTTDGITPFIERDAIVKKPGDLNVSGYPMVPPDLSGYADPDPDLPICGDCGMIHYTRFGHASCVKHTSLGLPCRQPRMSDLTICRKHGGHTRTNREMAHRRRMERARRLAEAEAAESLAKVGIEPLGNPLDRLEEAAAEAIALKSHFANVVAGLKDQYRFVDDKGSEQLDARVQLYERALDRSQKFLTELVRIGFEERRTALDEVRVKTVQRFLIGVLSSLGADPASPRVRAAIEAWSPVLDGQPDPVIDLDPVEDDEG